MNTQEVLHRHNLKRTSCREGILNAIVESDQALSENEIREKLEGSYDRTTFYRSFKTLIENNIVHKIVVDNQIVKYALDPLITLKHSHAHFYCETCECVKCMDSVIVDIPALPEGYQANHIELIIKGLCASCSHLKN